MVTEVAMLPVLTHKLLSPAFLSSPRPSGVGSAVTSLHVAPGGERMSACRTTPSKVSRAVLMPVQKRMI
jgi:hypothetical protein